MRLHAVPRTHKAYRVHVGPIGRPAEKPLDTHPPLGTPGPPNPIFKHWVFSRESVHSFLARKMDQLLILANPVP